MGMKTKGLFVALMALMMCFVCNESYAYDIAVENADGVTIYYDVYMGSDNKMTLQVTSENYIDGTYYLHGTYSGSVVIPNRVTFGNWTLSVTSIGERAFYNCTNLTSVTIPGSVTSIGEDAFYSCTGLTSLTIQDGVTSIGNSAFTGCSGLVSVTIPGSVMSIGEDAFYSCRGLTSVTIPGSVTSIGKRAFADCSELADVYCYAENVPTASTAFNDSPIQLSTLHVPASAIDSYRTTEPWSRFGTIVALTDQEMEDGIDDVNTSKTTTETVRYDINGRIISTPQKGINISRMSDGTTRKVLIR